MKCSFDGCEKKSFSKGLCAAHYQQQRSGKQLKPLQKQLHGLSEYERFVGWFTQGARDECWNWQGSRNKAHWHGQFRNAEGGVELAHRAAWRLMKGPIPNGSFVLHHCDNPLCVNPTHLFLGSQRDNMLDMWGKGRARPGTRSGEQHGMSKLTKEAVLDIRASGESGVTLAAKYGVSPTTIGEVRKRKTWNHI